MKHLLTLFPLLSFLFLFGCGKGSSPDEPSPLIPRVEVPGSSAKPMAYVKMIALAKLINKGVDVANVVKPGPQNAMLPMMAGMALGDASLSSIDPSAPCTFLLFDDYKEGDPTFVLAMKLKPESPVKKQAATLGMTTIEEKGWTLATMNPGFFEEVTDWSSVLSFAEEAPGEDLEVGVLLETFWKELPSIKESITQELGSSGMDSSLHLFIDEMASLDATRIEVSISTDEIMMRATVSAKEETELHALFSSQSSSPDPEVSKYVPSGGWLDLVMNLDGASFLKYFEHLFGLIEENLESPEVREMNVAYLSILRDSLKLYDGQAAMSYRVSTDGNPMNLIQVGSTQASASEFRELVEKSMGLSQRLFADSGLLRETGLKYDFELDQAEPIEGVEVLGFGMKMEGEGLVGQQIGNLAPLLDAKMFFAFHEGKYISVSERAELEKILKAMTSGQPVENSLAGQLTLTEGEVVAWRLDLVGYARLIGSVMLPLAGDDALEEVFAGLSELKISPLTGKIGLENGRISSEMRIPVESIKAGFDYFESAQQAALEEPEAINDLEFVVPEAKAD